MTEGSQASAMFENFNLPHGNDEVENSVDQELMDYEKGFSDDEGRAEAFDRQFPGPKTESPKKSPRRATDDDLEGSPKTKRNRFQSLFGGAHDSEAEGEEQHDEEQQLKTSGQGIGVRMSSLTLDQADELDNGEGPSRPPPLLLTSQLLGMSDKEGSPAFSERSSKLEDDLDIMPGAEDPVNAYGLRQNIDRTGAKTTWLDVDQSGNYDPQEEVRKKTLELAKAKARKRQSKAKGKGKGKQKAAPREIVLKKIAKLRFLAFGTVLNVVNDEENWPDGWSIVDSEDEREQQEYRAFYRRHTPGREPQTPIDDPKGEEEDLTGHPVARGCKDCRKYEQDCSAIENGEFPCAQCVEDKIECHAITPLKTLNRCRRCNAMDKTCSFEDPESAFFGSLCNQCFEAEELDCEPSSYKTNRVDLDRILYGPNRPWISCTYCRTHKKRCSLKKKEQKPPCSYCKRHNIGCTFYEAPKLDISSKKDGKRKVGDKIDPKKSSNHSVAPEVSVPGSEFFNEEDLADLEEDDANEIMEEEESEFEMDDAEGHRGIVTKLRTCFAHPIQFHTMENSTICSFCEIPIFSFVGHWEKTTHVLRWENGLGYTEIAGGHREEQDVTVMCQECVMQRVQIIACPTHEIRRIEGGEPNYEDAVNQLLSSEAGSKMMRHELQRWCSMCFSLASFECSTMQPSFMDEGNDDDSLREGCGLRLCRTCEGRLNEIFAGDVDAMATAYEAEPKAKEDDENEENVIRADVGFLRKEGLLMANVGHVADGAGEAEEGMEL